MTLKDCLALNVDEVGNNVTEVIPLLERFDINKIELRLIEGKNITNFSDREIKQLKAEIDKYGLEVCSIASPIFKWYRNKPASEQIYDSFNFPSYLSKKDKKSVIKRVIDHACLLETTKVRVFSNLNNESPSFKDFEEDEIRIFAINYANERNVALLLENEPVCNLYTVKDMLNALDRLDQTKIWLDIANFYYVHEEPTRENLNQFLPHVEHFHLKDFIWVGKQIFHVPLGQGIVPWSFILPYIIANKNASATFSIETHVNKNRLAATAQSIDYFNSILTS